MKIVDLEGRESTWNFTRYRVNADDARARSEPHLRGRRLLARLYPTSPAYEEVPMPGTRQKFDFVAPTRRLVVEVQGRQHFEHSTFMHGTVRDFGRSVLRDRLKAEFCETNNLTLVCLPDDETDEQWKDRLYQAGV